MKIRLMGGAALVAAAAVFAVGCGGDDDSSTTAATSSTTSTEAASGASDSSGGGETVAVSLSEYKIDPADPTVKAGDVTFDVTNDGAITHNLEIEGPDGESELEPDLAAGDSGSLTVDLSKPGTYEWYCPISNHRDQGMEGEITVD